MARVAIALGSNVGDRDRLLHAAVDALGPHVRAMQVSMFHETDPVGVGHQPKFLNAAAIGVTDLSARDLLRTLLDVERQFGRERPFPGAPRTLDLDLILYDDVILDEPGLVIPHPRFREREFVLAPLAEIAPEWKDPVTGRSVRDLLGDLAGSR